MIDYVHKNTELAKKLRKEMTPQEKHLWYDFLRSYPIKFQRQKPILNFIADFYCSKAKLVIELDGSQHYEEDQIKQDTFRTECIETLGIEVIRFSNLDIDRNFTGVCEFIDMITKKRAAKAPSFEGAVSEAD